MADSEELRLIFEADQADRRGNVFADDPMVVAKRDVARRVRVEELIAGGAVATGADHFHAAMVFQHGGSAAASRRAHELAAAARRLGDERGAWLAAAALDRWLMIMGRPQHYGTQYGTSDGRWVLLPVDPDTTDEERAAWNVPPVNAALARAERMTQDRPPAPEPAGLLQPVPLYVDRGQLERGEPVALDIDGAAPVMVPLAGLAELGGAMVVVMVPGAAADGSDLAVRVVVVDHGDDLDFRGWAAPWAQGDSRCAD